MTDEDIKYMRRALELARNGEGLVEPNPMVGCVIVRDGRILGEGWHQRFGRPHAEVEALRAAGADTAGSTCYVTLEPCSHQGKTPPCTNEILCSGIRRVVVAMRDPNPVVNGRGLEILRRSDLEITENVLEEEARQLNAPYLMRVEQKRPWIIVKWAMTLDGRTASRTGSSQWISGEASRQIVHRLRGRMDAIMVGSRTALADDSLLTVRLKKSDEDPESPRRRKTDPTGPRQPIRIVLDSKARLSTKSRLVRTAKEIPVLVVVSPDADPGRVQTLQKAGCQILNIPYRAPEAETLQSRERQRDFRYSVVSKGDTPSRPSPDAVRLRRAAYRQRMEFLLENLAENNVTNLLVEGGSRVFGTLFDLEMIDEVHVFIAPKLIGGRGAIPAIQGLGLPEMEFASRLVDPAVEILENDIYIHGPTRFAKDH